MRKTNETKQTKNCGNKNCRGSKKNCGTKNEKDTKDCK